MKAKTTVYTFNEYYNADIAFQELYPKLLQVALFIYLFTDDLSTLCCMRGMFFQTRTCKNKVEKSIESNNFGVFSKNHN